MLFQLVELHGEYAPAGLGQAALQGAGPLHAQGNVIELGPLPYAPGTSLVSRSPQSYNCGLLFWYIGEKESVSKSSTGNRVFFALCHKSIGKQ